MILIGGVDPGKRGAIVILRPRGKVELAVDMPEDDDELGDLWHTIALHDARMVIAVEKVWGNQKWGGRHNFEFGRQRGRVEQAIVSAALTFEHVTPTRWQRYFEMFKTPAERKGGQTKWKKRLQRKAHEIFDLDMPVPQADAFLIAEWARCNLS